MIRRLCFLKLFALSLAPALAAAPARPNLVVIQTDEQPLPQGQRVLIIYHDDRPRLVPAQ